MTPTLELAYLGIEVSDRPAFGRFLADVVGLVPGAPTSDGADTWRNDDRVQRLLVREGPAEDAVQLGFEAADPAAFEATAIRLERAGYPLAEAGKEGLANRRVDQLVRTRAPWGIDIELVHGLARADTAIRSSLVPGGFLTRGVGFGHTVFATTAFDEADHFVTEGLGMRQSDWIETEIATGIELEVRFYHCNPRHHSVALARAPFDLPQVLHHLMVEVNGRDDVGRAFDRAWDAGLCIANGLGRHDNDGMFSFYVASPAGFLVEVGHGARLVTGDWDGNRRYDRMSLWGHQPLARG